MFVRNSPEYYLPERKHDLVQVGKIEPTDRVATGHWRSGQGLYDEEMP